MLYLYSLTIAFFLTLAVIPLLSRYAGRLGLVDEPTTARKLHTQVMPRIGGLGIIIGATVPLLYVISQSSQASGLIPGCAVIVLFGLLDDRFELSPAWKLFGQSLAAVLVMAGGIVMHQLPFLGLDAAPAWLSYPVTFLFLVAVVNGVNFSDGLDGLAGGTSIMALLIILVLALKLDDVSSGLIAIAFIGGIVGFLRYNTYPARIFMGDTGSQFIGFLIACLAIIVTQGESRPYSPLLPVLLLGIPILDMLQVIPVRIYKGLPLTGPDNEHFHHQLVKLGFRHYEVVTIIYLLQALLMGAAYLLRFHSDLTIAVFYGTFVVTICGLILWANHVEWEFRKVHRSKPKLERRNRILRRIGWLYKRLAKVVSASTVLFMLLSVLVIGEFSGQVAQWALLLAGGFALATLLAPRYYPQITRISCACVSVLLAYLLSQSQLLPLEEYLVTGILVFLAAFLVLAIRMTRKQDFVFDTQDLLILLGVVLLPLLPFETLNLYSVSRIALTTFVLLYAVEFLINTGRGSVMLVNAASILTLVTIGAMGLL